MGCFFTRSQQAISMSDPPMICKDNDAGYSPNPAANVINTCRNENKITDPGACRGQIPAFR
jgi:hypothetical protein